MKLGLLLLFSFLLPLIVFAADNSKQIYSRPFKKSIRFVEILKNPKYKLKHTQNFSFLSEEDVKYFHSRIKIQKTNFKNCLLQSPAAEALNNTLEYAKKHNIPLTQSGKTTACLRSYSDTLKLWNKRVYANLNHYVEKGKISRRQADEIKSVPIQAQVKMILNLEKEKKLFFSTYRNVSILNSAAPPGTSDHITGWAVDIMQGNIPRSIHIMNKFGFYQTIPKDLNHFVYFGKLSKDELKKLK